LFVCHGLLSNYLNYQAGINTRGHIY
jgi:hypothetical protein